MNKLFPEFILALITFQLFAQSPDPAFNPMTAPGAIGISLDGHTLFWENPLDADYNEIYFSEDSAFVANLDPSVRIYNGYPSTVFSSASLNIFGSLSNNTKYFWRIVEHNTSGSTPSMVWYFKSKSPAVFYYTNYFNSGLEGWQIIGPSGLTNWYWQNSSFAGGSPGEIVFDWFPLFTGDAYILSPEFSAAANSYMVLNFDYYEDWWSDTVVVGCAYTTDNGNSWTSIWELNATGNVGPETFWIDLYIPGNFKLGFYYTGYSNNIDFLYVDNVIVETPLTVAQPPSLLQVMADTAELKVELQWDPGSTPAPPAPITGYQIQRKSGLPTDTNSYQPIVFVDSATFSFEDQNVELNKTYTYRICTVIGSSLSSYGNEATAYVPTNVPVELISFSGSTSGAEVILEWITATELNNQGFEIQRKTSGSFERVGFVEGKGTTTETQNYLFTDKNVPSGNHMYRLKQIDFDGSFEYSNTIEVTIDAPKKFSLSQNYPNPFNPSTTIRYEVPERSFVTLKVYDVLGNEIVALVNEEKVAGSYEVEFSAIGGSASGGNAHSLPSGVYFYQFKVGKYVETKKMVLLN